MEMEADLFMVSFETVNEEWYDLLGWRLFFFKKLNS